MLFRFLKKNLQNESRYWREICYKLIWNITTLLNRNKVKENISWILIFPWSNAIFLPLSPSLSFPQFLFFHSKNLNQHSKCYLFSLNILHVNFTRKWENKILKFVYLSFFYIMYKNHEAEIFHILMFAVLYIDGFFFLNVSGICGAKHFVMGFVYCMIF